MLQRTLLALALYCLASLGAPYLVYKNFAPHTDAMCYLEMIDRPWSELDSPAPYRYRILTPLLTRGLWWMSALPAEVRAKDVLGTIDQRSFWNLIVVNYAQALIAAALCFYLAHAIFRFDAGIAFVGGMFFLFAYPSVANWTMVDVGAHAFILLALVCYFRQSVWAFGVVCLVGALQKEIVFVTLGSFLALETIRRRTAIWPWFAALAPAVLLYAALPLAWPAPVYQLERGTIGMPSWRSLDILFNREFLLSLAPFVVALLAHAYLRLRHGARLAFPLIWLLLVPVLCVVSIVTSAVGDTWAASGRLTLFAFGVIMLYQLEVLEAVAARAGWINAPAHRDPAVWSPWKSRATAAN